MFQRLRIHISVFFHWLADRLAHPPAHLPWKKAVIHYRAVLRAERVQHQKQSHLLLWVLNQITDDQLEHVRRGEGWLDEVKKTNSPGGRA